MLVLTLEAAGAAYALPAADVHEVVPQAQLRELPHAPAWLRGLLGYRGALVPVVDLSSLLGGGPTPSRMSVRILIDSTSLGRGRLVGLMAARVIDVVQAGEPSLSGLAVPGAPYLGGILQLEGRPVQLLRVGALLPEELLAMLYPAEAAVER